MKLNIDPKKEVERLWEEREGVAARLMYTKSRHKFIADYCKALEYSNYLSLETTVNPDLVKHVDYLNEHNNSTMSLDINEESDFDEFSFRIFRNVKEHLLRCLKFHCEKLYAHKINLEINLRFIDNEIKRYSEKIYSENENNK